MKKLLSSMWAAIGLRRSVRKAPQVVSVDPKTIMFSMSTVAADDIEFVVPSPQSFDGAPQFHEDEWRQVEFYPSSQTDVLMTRLTEYKLFERRHRTEYGWTDIYARRIPGPGILQGARARAELAALLRATPQPSPILSTTSSHLGQVKDGFTLRLADSVFLYGVAGTSGVESLAAIVELGGDDACLAAAFAKLYGQYKLVLIDWRQQMLLTSVGSDGRISVWRP
jgi:hypothetical protein